MFEPRTFKQLLFQTLATHLIKKFGSKKLLVTTSAQILSRENASLTRLVDLGDNYSSINKIFNIATTNDVN